MEKIKFCMGLIIIKVNIKYLESVIEKFLRKFFTPNIILMATVEFMIGSLLFLINVKKKNKKKTQFKETDFFWQNRVQFF